MKFYIKYHTHFIFFLPSFPPLSQWRPFWFNKSFEKKEIVDQEVFPRRPSSKRSAPLGACLFVAWGKEISLRNSLFVLELTLDWIGHLCFIIMF